MSGSMGVGANFLSFTAGTAGAAGTGAYTIAALVQPAVGNNNMGIVCLLAGGARQRTVSEDTNKLFGEGDFTGFGTLVQGSWYLVIGSKASGSAALTWRIWLYDPVDFTGALQDGTSQTVGDGSTVDEIRIGQTFNLANGLYAVVGVWTRQLSLAECQSMRSNLLTAWRDVSGGAPDELIHLRDWDGTTGAVVAIGTATFSGETGTVGVGSDPPSFDFDLGGGDVAADAVPNLGLRPAGSDAVLGVDTPDPAPVAARPGGSPAAATADVLAVDPGSGGVQLAGSPAAVAVDVLAPDVGPVGLRPAGSPAEILADVLATEPGGPGAQLGSSPASGLAAVDSTAAALPNLGLRFGGSPAAAGSDQVVHDQMVMPILLNAMTCLQTELGKVANPPEHYHIRPGQSFIALADNVSDECCSGIGFVRPNTDTPTSGNWPTPLFDVGGPSASRGVPSYYAVQVQVGVYRCIPTVSNVPGDENARPTAAQWLQATQEHLDDRAALRRVVCCLQAIYGTDAVLSGPFTPLQNEGNCGGQFVMLTVRAPACDCVE